ncbi:helix-turn-helix domain-containing protein [Mycolicibacterium conceptionense]|uniref:helix-turn-helix domain-containing protein n=1 Tax=Mycolicibacterium conceptionense TaxID=451644 RepID=UPI003204C812
MSAPTGRHDGLAPILASGLRWLYDTEQPRGALLRPGGVALPPVHGRWYIFAPGVRRPGAAIVVQAEIAGPSDLAKELDAELTELAALVTKLTGVDARVTSTSGASVGRVDLDAAAHPSLVDAVRRYLAGCPTHRQHGCGHAHGAQAPCRWYADGFARLVQPDRVLPHAAIADSATPAEPSPQAPPTPAAPQPVGLRTANDRRRDRAATRAVKLAQRAIVVLSDMPHRRAVTEEALAVLRLRVAHPELSLSELAALHEPPITKDTYSARLRRALIAAGTRQGRPKQKSTTAA